MRYPDFLPKKGTIGCVAPSFGCNTEPYRSAFDNAQKKWKKMGYTVDPGPNCYAGEGIGISNTPEKCGAEINEWYARSENDVLISCGGGELMCGILDYVDFDRIREGKPKWFMGFSDNTNLTYLLTTLCDTASIYGPNAAAFGMEPWHKSLRDAMNILTGKSTTVSGYPKWEKEGLKDADNPLLPYHVTKRRILKRFPDADTVFSGRMLGGCMDCLVNLLGTKYDRTREFIETYKEDGIIWFLESCDLNVMGIRRAVWQMEHAGWFRYTRGFLIGRPLCFGQEMMGMDQYRAVTEVLEHYQVPIIMDVDLGHLPPTTPLVTGSIGTVTVEGNRITIGMELR